MANVTSALALRSVRRKVSELVAGEVCDERVLQVLLEDGPVPAESELWDYKSEAPSNPLGWAKLVKSVAALYNTYGGYLFFGIEEREKDKHFEVQGCDDGLNFQTLHQTVRKYLGQELPVRYSETTLQNGKRVGTLLVPRRPARVEPAMTDKVGPDHSPGKPAFQRGAVFYRGAIENRTAEGYEDFRFLFGAREDPELWDLGKPTAPTKKVLANNMPDRELIYTTFVGRDEILGALWQWFAEPFSRVKALVGDGGRGKTSIAYRFATDVCITATAELERVIWLTAKSKRFDAFADAYVEMPETHYRDSGTLLSALALEMGLLPKETEDLGPRAMLSLLQDTMRQLPVFVVIDDVDSTSVEEQREILDVVHVLTAGSQARFLLTTRMDLSFRAGMTIQVPGLREQHYEEFLTFWLGQLQLPPLRPKQIAAIHQVTDGSPLFTESLLRLCKQGQPIDAAIQAWKGRLGAEVRNAALQREIRALTLESRRVLFACALRGEASRAELKEITGYVDDRMQQCFQELQALFLVSSPRIIRDEPRFSVPTGTRLLILEHARSIVPDPVAIEKATKRLGKAAKSSGKHSRVGFAITQAVALLRDGDIDAALRTLDEAMKTSPRNGDLLSAQAMCFKARYERDGNRNDLDQARRLYRDCFDAGHRKPDTLSRWYESERLSEHWSGAIEVAALGKNCQPEAEQDWLRRLWESYVSRAMAQMASSNVAKAVEDYEAAADVLSEAYALPSAALFKPGIVRLMQQAHDAVWSLLSEGSDPVGMISGLMRHRDSAFKRGDKRQVWCDRMLDVLDRLCSWGELNSPLGNGIRTVVRHRFNDVAHELKRLSCLADGTPKGTRYSRLLVRRDAL